MKDIQWLREFRSAAAGGLAIAFGGTAYLLADNKLAGAFLFCVGLFAICVMGLNLFTGKACGLVRSHGAKDAGRLAVIWLGNLCGAVCAALLLSVTRLADRLVPSAQAVCQGKLAQTGVSTFVLGIFCNIMIWLAVTGYRECLHETGKYLALIFGVMVFVACGFEHCVADMFYLAMAGEYSLRGLLFLLICTAGNVAGAVAVPLIRGKQIAG